MKRPIDTPEWWEAKSQKQRAESEDPDWGAANQARLRQHADECATKAAALRAKGGAR